MRLRKFFLFIAVIVVSFFLPTDESLWHALSRVALVVWVIRHLKRDYDEFVETLDSGRKRRR
jgi:hypothetical protein